MSKNFVPHAGAVFSADIAVSEHERELAFYARVLTTGAQPLWQELGLLNNLGIPIIGLGKREAAHADLPLQWMPHIQVADIAASVQTAADMGGNVIMHAKDEQGISQWAMLADPNGAAFGVITLPPEAGAAASEEKGDASFGHIAWLDLTVPDAAQTRDFYKAVIGWESTDFPMMEGDEAYNDYGMEESSGETAAGICHARGGNIGIPSVWIIYLAVGEMAESIARATAEGGTILKTSMSAEGVFEYAVIRDPVGVVFGVVPG